MCRSLFESDFWLLSVAVRGLLKASLQGRPNRITLGASFGWIRGQLRPERAFRGIYPQMRKQLWIRSTPRNNRLGIGAIAAVSVCSDASEEDEGSGEEAKVRQCCKIRQVLCVFSCLRLPVRLATLEDFRSESHLDS